MPSIQRAGASLPGYRLRARTALRTNCLGLYNLTGGSAEEAVRNLLPGMPPLTVVGSPVFTPLGVICDADNYLDTGIVGGASQLSLAVVAVRTPACVYLGNLHTTGASDSILETSDGLTRVRYWNGAAVNLDLTNPVRPGDFMFVCASFATTSNGMVGGQVDGEDVEEEGSDETGGRLHPESATLRFGRGGVTAFTDETVLISGGGVWSDTINSEAKGAVVRPFFAEMVEPWGIALRGAA